MRLAEAAAEHREVLAEDEDQSAIHGTEARDHAIAGDLLLGHAEIVRAMLDEHAPFLEGAGIEQHLETLARGELALGVLRGCPLLAAACRGGAAFLLQS